MTIDAFGRRLRYLRLSITDVCNFRCVYCLPNGYTKCETNFLSVDEIRHLVKGFSALGFGKIRITGGEPTTRADLFEIVSAISETSGIEKVVLSTNGYKLLELAKPLRDAGVSGINVSLDSLDAERFRQITGKNNLAEILRGVDAALAVGFSAVKINAVLMRDQNIDDIDDFIRWTKDTPVSVRFIELMQNGTNRELFERRHVSATVVRDKLDRLGWTEIARERDAGPAVEYSHSAHRGRIGIIAPYAKDFCASCNRLRVTSVGGLRLCLFGELDYPLRRWLKSADQLPAFVEHVQRLIGQKKEAHFLHEGLVGTNQHFAQIGG